MNQHTEEELPTLMLSVCLTEEDVSSQSVCSSIFPKHYNISVKKILLSFGVGAGEV